MVIIAVKKYCVKKEKEYGPYPSQPDVFYLYEVYREGDQVKQKYLGKGPRPACSVVQENSLLRKSCRGCKDLTRLDRRPFCAVLKSFLTREAMRQPCYLEDPE